MRPRAVSLPGTMEPRTGQVWLVCALRTVTVGIAVMCFGLQIYFMPLIANDLAEVLGSARWASALASALPILTLPLGATVAVAQRDLAIRAGAAILVACAIAWLAACSARRTHLLASVPECTCLGRLLAHESAVLRTNRAAVAGFAVLIAAGSLVCMPFVGAATTQGKRSASE